MQQAEEGCKRCGSSAPRRGPSLFCEPCRNSLQEAGTCLRCGDHPLDRPRYCTQCRTLDNEKRQKAAIAKRSATPTGKVCRSCSKPADWSSRSHYCPECRAKVKAQGLCTRCGTNPLPEGRRFCEACLELDIKSKDAGVSRRLTDGLCRCGSEPAAGQKECGSCRKRKRSAHRVYRSRKRAEGICGNCLVLPAPEGRSACSDCLEAASLRNRHLRLKVLCGYGSACACCGEMRERFLELDHVSASWEGPRPSSETGSPLLLRLVAEGFPSGYQALCSNCNWSKRLFGSCTLAHGKSLPPPWSSYLTGLKGTSRHRLQLRIEALTAYGDRCSCCSEADLQVLALDHVHGGGNAERRSVGGSADALYRALRRRDWPPGYRVLCASCNRAVHLSPTCPHADPSALTAISALKLLSPSSDPRGLHSPLDALTVPGNSPSDTASHSGTVGSRPIVGEGV